MFCTRVSFPGHMSCEYRPLTRLDRSLQYPANGGIGANTVQKWWGNTVHMNTADWNYTALRTLPKPDGSTTFGYAFTTFVTPNTSLTASIFLCLPCHQLNTNESYHRPTPLVS